MPTTRPRHTITETDALADALDAAARRWPEERGVRSRLLLRLIEEGRRVVVEDEEARIANRLAAIEATAGALTGSYELGYLAKLREDWPE
jgi:hypothetical protein